MYSFIPREFHSFVLCKKFFLNFLVKSVYYIYFFISLIYTSIDRSIFISFFSIFFFLYSLYSIFSIFLFSIFFSSFYFFFIFLRKLFEAEKLIRISFTVLLNCATCCELNFFKSYFRVPSSLVILP